MAKINAEVKLNISIELADVANRNEAKAALLTILESDLEITADSFSNSDIVLEDTIIHVKHSSVFDEVEAEKPIKVKVVKAAKVKKAALVVAGDIDEDDADDDDEPEVAVEDDDDEPEVDE